MSLSSTAIFIWTQIGSTINVRREYCYSFLNLFTAYSFWEIDYPFVYSRSRLCTRCIQHLVHYFYRENMADLSAIRAKTSGTMEELPKRLATYNAMRHEKRKLKRKRVFGRELQGLPVNSFEWKNGHQYCKSIGIKHLVFLTLCVCKAICWYLCMFIYP